jgi:protein-disulfide isomerase
MDQNRPMTKQERKDARRLERLAQNASGNSSNLLKWGIIIGGSALFLLFFGFLVFLIKQNQNKPITLSSSGWTKGAETASLSLVEFGDLQCPACRAYEPFVRNAMKDYDGKLKFTFKHFPLSGHLNAMLAAKVVEAAGLQGKFWEMHDWLYDNQELWAPLTGAEAKEKMTEQAKKLSLDIERFNKDIDSPEVTAKIESQQNEGIEVGVSATPTFFINNKKIESNPQSYEDFKKVIEASLPR